MSEPINLQNRIIETGMKPADQFQVNPLNHRKHPMKQRKAVEASLRSIGWIQGVIENKRTGHLIDGHERVWQALQSNQDVPYVLVDLSEEEEKLALAVFDKITSMAEVDADILEQLLQDVQTDEAELMNVIEEMAEEAGVVIGESAQEQARQTLQERFVVPPFSVLDARQGYWQDRKRAWIDLGLQSELGRGENIVPNGTIRKPEQDGCYLRTARKTNGLLGESQQARSHYKGKEAATRNSSQNRLTALQKTGSSAVVYGTEGNASEQTGTSIFDPVLCEIVYRWFCPKNAAILDTFAGGSVRGVVASKLGHDYTGIDLSERQIEANKEQGLLLCEDKQPNWIVGDSAKCKELAGGEYDFVFSCPPYADLEVYSDAPEDLSNMPYIEFLEAYRRIISNAVSMLKDNRFSCFVVGDIRDKKGFYRNFVSDTIQAFLDAGMSLYNEAILVTAIGSLPIRVGKQFQSYRKLGKTHQNVLIFYKGNPKEIKTWGDVECGDITKPTP